MKSSCSHYNCLDDLPSFAEPFQGNKVWSQSLTSDITCMCLVPLKHQSACLLAVGLRGGAIQLYKGRDLVDVINISETPGAITFGHMGQEEHVLVIVTLSNYYVVEV